MKLFDFPVDLVIHFFMTVTKCLRKQLEGRRILLTEASVSAASMAEHHGRVGCVVVVMTRTGKADRDR